MDNMIYKRSKFKNFLYRDVKEYNLVLILIIGVLFITLSGYTSYALFSMNLTSSKTIIAQAGDIAYTRTYEYVNANYFTWIAPKAGYYRLEVWGAAGSDGDEGAKRGGYGAYATGAINVTKGQNLFLYIGQEGQFAGVDAYNGGSHGTWTASYMYDGGGGGGATHIASATGLLKDVDASNVYIAAGAGGGGSEGGIGGNGGGYVGVNGGGTYYGKGGNTSTSTGGGNAYTSSANCGTNNSYNVPNYCSGGYGYGSSVVSLYGNNSNYYAGGGGSGFYGGGAGDWSSTKANAGGGGGGSSYIGSATLVSDATTSLTKHMACHSCTASATVDNNHTILITTVSDEPISDTAKTGNGAVRITWLHA